MRLGQLARKLGLRPGEIIEFLKSRHIPVNEGSNSKLDDHHVVLIVQQLAPDMTGKIFEPEAEPEQQKEDAVMESAANIEMEMAEPQSDEPAHSADQVGEIPQVKTDEPVEEKAEKVDVIKAPKVELPGLRVVGKIDLPEPKKKEQDPPASEPTLDAPVPVPEDKKTSRSNTRDNLHRGRPANRSGKNSVALQREREARAAAKKKQMEAELEKERRRQRYLKKVKPAVPTKPVRIIDEHVIEMSEEPHDEPRSLWGKFIKWFWRK